jgi:hypothetical protein
MSKKPVQPKRVLDPNPLHPPIDKDVQLPHQVRRAAALADALVTGQPAVPIPTPKRTRSELKIALTDAQIDEALQRWEQGGLKVTDPQFRTIIELAREGARLIKAHRRGARQPRKKSDSVTERLEALLQAYRELLQAYRELSPKRQEYPTGTMTLGQLRKSMIAKLGLRDDNKVISEDTIKKDIEQIRPLLKLVRKGIIPPPGKPIKKQETISEKTRQEMEAGKRAVAKAAARYRILSKLVERIAAMQAGHPPEAAPPAAISESRH